MAIIVQDYGTVGGGNANLYTGTNPITYTTNTWIDSGVKATDASMIFFFCGTNSYNAANGGYAEVNNGVITPIVSDYASFQVNSSGNIEVKTNLTPAYYPTMNLYIY